MDDATVAPPYLGGNGQKKASDVPRIASHEGRFKGPGKNGKQQAIVRELEGF